VKILSGTRRDRVNRNEPAHEPGRSEPPARFTGEVLARWNQLCDLLEGTGVLSPAHAPALEVYCAAYGRSLKAARAIQEHGLVIRTPKVYSHSAKPPEGVEPPLCCKANPAAGIAAQADKTMLAVLTEFGMTPASASRVSVSTRSRADDDLEAFLRRDRK
jgi:P27 family predicted phage terminase small subunit